MKCTVNRAEIADMARLTKQVFSGDSNPPAVLVFARNENGEICVSSPARCEGVILRATRYMTRKEIKEKLMNDSVYHQKGGD